MLLYVFGIHSHKLYCNVLSFSDPSYHHLRCIHLSTKTIPTFLQASLIAGLQYTNKGELRNFPRGIFLIGVYSEAGTYLDNFTWGGGRGVQKK